MVKYDKSNCGEEVSLEEVKSKLVDMLLVLADYCEKNGIRAVHIHQNVMIEQTEHF